MKNFLDSANAYVYTQKMRFKKLTSHAQTGRLCSGFPILLMIICFYPLPIGGRELFAIFTKLEGK